MSLSLRERTRTSDEPMPPYSTRTRPPTPHAKVTKDMDDRRPGPFASLPLSLPPRQSRFELAAHVLWRVADIQDKLGCVLVGDAVFHKFSRFTASQHSSSPASHWSAMRWITPPNRFTSLVFVCRPSNSFLRLILSFTTVRLDHLLIRIYGAIINTPSRSSSISFSALYPGEL